MSAAAGPGAASPSVRWWASLLPRTIALVAGVVLALGALVVLRLTDEDRRDALADARRAEQVAEQALRDLARDLVGDGRALATALVESADARTRAWLEEEPLSLYRDRTRPDRVDVDALRRALTARVRARGRDATEHVAIVAERMESSATARIDRVLDDLAREDDARARASASERRSRLSARLALLLAGLALLLGFSLWRAVLRPAARLRSAVARMAGGDLSTPVGEVASRRDEIGALARDVDAMRDDLRRSREGLEQEVARKTADLARTLAERTAALAELGATRDRLVQAAKMASLGTLAGGLAHEFNNLLGGIRNCVESARAENRDPSVGEDLDVVDRTAARGLRLVKSLLDVARPGARALERVDLTGLVDDVLRASAPAAQRDHVVLRREVVPVPAVLGDAAQLHQVVLNLVTNALQAVDEGETVVVALRPDGDRVLLEVRDEGPGVDPALRDRIFEPFFSGREGGTGLGLFVSYGIVERHGGTLEVGDAPEGGARFSMRLPRAPEGSGPPFA
ncbi:MAG: HAMP domain-containing protein [Planctomycetes bacterium]|nr:HAMP domain-containing protein [Planctomycetota bacterium]